MTKKPSQQCHKCLQNTQQCLEVPAVQHKDQVEAVTELCTLYPVVRLRVSKYVTFINVVKYA